MKFVALVISLLSLLTFALSVEAKSYSRSYRTPSIRSYSSSSYKVPSATRNYKSGGQLYMQKGYVKRDGTYIQPHLKTKPDNSLYNNRKYLLGY